MSDKKPSKKALEEVHKRALKRADDAYTFERENISNGRDCQRFYLGGPEQWDDAARKARGTNRPMLTVNRQPALVRQVTGEIRRDTPAVKVLPAKGNASKEVAEVFTGLIRNIEAQSDADACYCFAAENAAIASQGAFRIVRVYSSDDSFEQDIRFQPIRDPFGFMVDPLANLPDKSDMKFGFVFSRMSKDDYEAAYPDAPIDDMPMNAGTRGDNGFAWRVGDSVRIAEYFEKETEKATLYLLEDGRVVDEVPDGAKVKRQREVERENVVSYIMSGAGVLDGPHDWLGKYIPICVVPGEEITVDGATTRKGMIHDARDPQRLLNYARTTDAEQTALQPKAPYLLTKKQIAGYENMWNQAGTENLPYLVYVPDAGAGTDAPKRSQPPVMSTGLANLSLSASQDLKDVTGIYDASLGAKSNETSGRAIIARQKEGDTGTFLYTDNLRRAIAYGGRVLVDLIPKVYDSERIVRVLKENGDSEMKTINGPDPEDPKAMVIDLSIGEYDVVVSTGQSYMTRREERREALLQLTQNVPTIGEVAADLLVDALDFPGGDEISKRLKLKMGIGEDGEPTEQKPDPKAAAEALATSAKADLTSAQAEGQEIKNATDFMALQQMMAMIGEQMQTLQAGMQQMMAMQGGQGQQPGPQAQPQPPQQPMPPPEAAPPQIDIPPDAQLQGDDGGEVVDMPEGAPV